MGEEITVSGFAKYRLDRAKEDLADAELCYKNRRYLTANNRANISCNKSCTCIRKSGF